MLRKIAKTMGNIFIFTLKALIAVACIPIGMAIAAANYVLS